MTRQILPSRRRAVTITLQFGGQTVTITTGFHIDGELGEVFINIGKSGTDIASLARDAGVLLSLALQHGVHVETICHAVTRGASEEPASVLGAVVDYILTNLSSPRGDI